MMVQAKPPGAWEQEFARLSYEWEKVYAYGDTDSMCTDGVILNRIRQELSELKEKLDVAGTDGEWLIPPEAEKSFMPVRMRSGYGQEPPYRSICHWRNTGMCRQSFRS